MNVINVPAQLSGTRTENGLGGSMIVREVESFGLHRRMTWTLQGNQLTVRTSTLGNQDFAGELPFLVLGDHKPVQMQIVEWGDLAGTVTVPDGFADTVDIIATRASV